jgi:class 3 adenylate cyclase/tetratricopeptide (TPR) repeat protein
VAISAHRKVVTVLFCDVVGSTALGESVDPEALQGILARYFERMKGVVESHGGSVEKFIGDAVMAVFGVPVAHEDDALRACRAAVEMRDALPELGVEGRIGINTGQVLTGTEERLATGDAVNVAARLQQAAQPSEVLLGAETLALVRTAVEVGGERLLELKGKSEPVAAHALAAVREAPERSHTARFVGRELELEQLADAWERARAGPRCELVTVVGDPGVGKSRLVAEALDRINARAVRGHCLSYGEGITYWPVVEVVKQLDVVPSDEAAASAIKSLLAESDAVSSKDEIAWAFRKLLEEQAPLVVCFDDLQWGEATFLDLVESTVLLSAGVRLLIFCMARPELLDRRPGWPGTLRLEPLAGEEAVELVGDAIAEEIRDRIVIAAGGNPLFLTEMVALSADSGGEVEVPPTLRALLAARLDQLDEPDRQILERGAVEGELFHRGSVQALAPEEIEVTPRLAALVRRELVRPDRPQLPRQDAYRFRHLLIRDAAYDALPKATRADLHRRFAAWLEEHGESLVELDEILGYHIEQAARYLDELGRANPELAVAAGERLATAGRRSLERDDRPAAAALIERALELMRPYRLDVHLEVDLALVTDDFREMARIADAAAARAKAAGDPTAVSLAQMAATYAKSWTGGASAEELERVARAALPLLEAAGDDAGLAQVWFVLGNGVANMRGRYEDWAQAEENAIAHRRNVHAADPRLGSLPLALMLGPRPAGEALATLDVVLAERPRGWFVLGFRAVLLAMLDRFAEAWQLVELARTQLREYGHGEYASYYFFALVAILAGDDEAAAHGMRMWCTWQESRGATSALPTHQGELGRVLCRLGKYGEAERLARRAREFAEPNDPLAQALWRQVQSLVLAHRAEFDEAERVVREGVAWTERSDSVEFQGHALFDLAEVLEAAGRRDDAVAAWREALDRYERKQIIPLACRVRDRLATLQQTAS